MSIASEKVKHATERFLLVRLNPARYILPVLNGSVYEITLPFTINKIERLGVALTKDTSTPSVDDHWYQNESTGLVQIKLASAPNDTTNVLIAFHYLFYTGTVFRSVSEDPENTATTTRLWEPRIINYPSVIQSFGNIIAGVLTVQNTSLEIINENGNIQEFLTEDDSFYNKEAVIWLCINSTSNIQRIFTGKIDSISLTQNTARFNLLDSFSALKQRGTMVPPEFSSASLAYHLAVTGILPRGHNKPQPYIFGASSRIKTIGIDGMVSGGPEPYVLTDEILELFTHGYVADVSTTTNRTWPGARGRYTIATQSFGAVQAHLDTGTGFRFVRFASLSNVEVGDTIKWTEGGTDYYGIINHVGTFTYSSVNYNIVFSDPSGPFSLASTVANLKSGGVVITRNNQDPIYPRIDRDVVLSNSALTFGGYSLYAEFVNNFETNFSGFTALNPQTDRVFVRFSQSTVDSHAAALKYILETAGLTTNTTSFTNAETALSTKVRFHQCNFDESDYDTYLKYVQDILKSTLGFLRINSDDEIEYYLLDAPTSSSVRDSSLTLDGATRCEVDYRDIATEIIAYNPHYDSKQAIDLSSSPAETESAPKARYLHNINNVDRFRHVLEEISSKILDHINLKSKRNAIYSFSTSTEDIDTELGDDIELQNKIVLGSSDTQDLKVISIDKSPGRTSLEAQDLKGL